jgi:hypothetical protein
MSYAHESWDLPWAACWWGLVNLEPSHYISTTSICWLRILCSLCHCCGCDWKFIRKRLVRFPYWHHSRPSNMIYQNRSVRKQTSSNGSPSKHCQEFLYQLRWRLPVGQHISWTQPYISKKSVLKVTCGAGGKLVMRPEWVIEGKVTVTLGVIQV